MTGKVKWFKADKGFGFIIGEDGQDYFVHHSAIEEKGYRTLNPGDLVTFEAEPSDKGLKAVKVRVTTHAPTPPATFNRQPSTR